MKHYIKLLSLLAAGLILLSACTPAASSQSVNNQAPYTINATGTGKVYLTPDIAHVSIGVHTEDSTVADALRKNSEQATALNKTLTDMGVQKTDIQTSAFNVSPNQPLDNQSQPGKTVYVVDNTVYVTVRDLSTIGKLLDGAVSSGANKINGLTFDVQDKSKSMTEARRLAVEDAKAQAQELAGAAGVKLGKLTTLNAYANTMGAAQFDSKAIMAAPNSASVPTSAGQLIVQVDVNLSYEIVQ